MRFTSSKLAALLLLVACGDVGVAEEHEVVDVVASLEEEASHGAVGDDVLGKDDGAHVEHDELLDVAHLFAQRQAQALEDAFDHVGAAGLVAVERPALLGVVVLNAGFADVVQQSRPAEP